MNYVPPPNVPDPAKVKELASQETLRTRFNTLLDQATLPHGSERIEAKVKCRNMFDTVLEASQKAAAFVSSTPPSDAEVRSITHQIRSAATIVFRDTPGVDKHSLEAGDPLLWVGVMAATITAQRERIAHLEEILGRYLPAAPAVSFVEERKIKPGGEIVSLP